ncbi:MAG: radical SAM protein [Candidatus Pacearchaeota archaeon]
MKINEVKTKSALTRSNLPEADYVINPYIGCQHACIYCYADFMKRFTGHSSEDWGTFVDVKINAPETLIVSGISSNDLILIGSVTDPYQAVEAKYKLTRKCLEVLLDSQPNIEILTKSPLILRDLDLLKKFKRLRVGVSIGVLDRGYSKELEPFAPSPQERLDTLKTLYEAGIRTYLFISPIFPEISEVYELIDQSMPFVEEVLFENLNIRANNKVRVLSFIRQRRPSLEDFYRSLPRNKTYWDSLERDISDYCRGKGIKYKIFFHHGTKK